MLLRGLLAMLMGLLLMACASSAKEPTPPPATPSQPATTSKQATAESSQPTVQPSATPQPSATAPASPTAQMATPPPEPTVSPKAEPLVRQAKQDLAQKQSLPVGEVRVVKVEEIEWPDASLGCPEPGKMYAQVITPGYRITLEARGATYEYHTDTQKHIVQCSR